MICYIFLYIMLKSAKHVHFCQFQLKNQDKTFNNRVGQNPIPSTFVYDFVTLKAYVERGGKVVIIGDGRYDSPGFTAFYCTYVVMVKLMSCSNYFNYSLFYKGLQDWENHWFFCCSQRSGKKVYKAKHSRSI